MRSVWASLFLVACSAAGCAPEPPDAERARAGGAITAGEPSAEASVVGISGSGEILCTGVAIAPRLVLTAAHCLAGAAERSVWIGASTGSGRSVAVARVFRHPDFVDGEASHDIGLVFTAAPMGVPAVPLSSAPLGPGDLGRVVRVVGFGRTSADDASKPLQRAGESTITAVDDRTFRVANSPSQPCLGDSGGPVLANGSVLGVVSAGDDRCLTGADIVRGDRALDEFVRPILARASTTAGAAGVACLEDAACASGLCAAFGSAPSFPRCSGACGEGGACPAGFVCASSLNHGLACALPEPLDGSLGAPCAYDVECETGFCARARAGGSSACARICFVSDARACPDGFVCGATSGGVNACLQEPAAWRASGGCSSSGAGGAEGLLTAALGALLAAGRFRKRTKFGD